MTKKYKLYKIFYFYFYKIFCLIYRGLLVCFYQGGTGVPCPSFLVVVAPFDTVSLRFICWSVVVLFYLSRIGVAEGGWRI